MCKELLDNVLFLLVRDFLPENVDVPPCFEIPVLLQVFSLSFDAWMDVPNDWCVPVFSLLN